MMKTSLKIKILRVIIFSIALLVTTATALFTVDEINEMKAAEKDIVARSVNNASMLAYMIVPDFVDNNYAFMDHVVSYYGQKRYYRYVGIVDAKNRVLAGSGIQRGGTFEVPDAFSIQNIDGGSVRRCFVNGPGKELIDISYPIKAGDLVLGSVHVGLDPAWIGENRAGLLKSILAFLGAASIITGLAVLMSSRITTRIVQPVLLLKDTAEKVGKGDYDQSVQIRTSDEVAVLAASFNKMTDDLRKARARSEEQTEELRQANEKLRAEIVRREQVEGELVKAQKLKSLGILAGGIAHDFNNLLNTILNVLSVTMIDIRNGRSEGEHLRVAERAVLHAKDIARQLLTFSDGGAPIRRTVSIESVIRESADFAVQGSAVTCRITAPDGLWLTDVDQGQISQVIHNLVINAVQAMPDGGRIDILCENALLPDNAIPLLPPGRYVKVAVRDTGLGIPLEDLGKIFDPFYTTKKQGSGLGLAIAHSILRKHNGSIIVESRPGDGASFTLFLPASAATETAPPPPTDDAELVMGTGRILLMDDDQGMLHAAPNALQALGYTAVPVRDGEQAVRLYREALASGEPFDAVILDLTVRGGMGGKEAIKQLLALDPGVKAIASSAYSDDPVMAEFRKYGFTAILVKPYRLEELGRTMDQVIAKAAKEAQFS